MKNTIMVFIVILGFIALVSAAFIVDETEQVIITQFGKPIGSPITDPGIHFKIPVIQKANFFDRRYLEWDGDKNQVPTKDKRFIWVDTYARWRIKDPLLFFQTRNAIAKHLLVEIVRSTNREYRMSDEILGEEETYSLVQIKDGREKITRDIIEAAAPRILELGIELLDLRFKRINYVEEVQKKIFERMITERKRIAD
jgi:membrane protease subunit HflC